MRNELDRWWDKVDRSKTDEECWEWKGAKYRKGYGHFRRKINDKWVMYPAHIFAYEHFIWPVEDGQLVCHKCDNPGCVNPKHLFIGSHQDNHDDMDRKGRRKFGRNPNHHHLSKEVAGEIRTGWNEISYPLTQKDFAQLWGISPQQMSRILNNQTWK